MSEKTKSKRTLKPKLTQSNTVVGLILLLSFGIWGDTESQAASNQPPTVQSSASQTAGQPSKAEKDAAQDPRYLNFGKPEVVIIDESSGEVISDNRPMTYLSLRNQGQQKPRNGQAPNAGSAPRPQPAQQPTPATDPSPTPDPTPPSSQDPCTTYGLFDPRCPLYNGGGGYYDPSYPSYGNDPISKARDIINLGKEIWDIVQQNRPITKYESNYATAVPASVTDWRDLSDWQIPRSVLVSVAYKNLFGAEVVKFAYRILYTYGGKLDDKGLYLTNATIVPHNLKVSWGYSVDAKVDVPSVINVGNRANPIAGMEMLLRWTVSTALKETTETSSYFIRGDGALKDISRGN